MLLEHNSEIGRGGGVAPPVGAAIRRASAGNIALLLEQQAQVEAARWLDLESAAVVLLRSLELPSQVQQHAKIRLCREVTALGRASVGLLRAAEIALLFEFQRNSERCFADLATPRSALGGGVADTIGPDLRRRDCGELWTQDGSARSTANRPAHTGERKHRHHRDHDHEQDQGHARGRRRLAPRALPH